MLYTSTSGHSDDQFTIISTKPNVYEQKMCIYELNWHYDISIKDRYHLVVQSVLFAKM